MKQIFITGIHTDIGKTVVSTILCHALSANYWKPVQAGSLEQTDADFVKKYNSSQIQFPSTYNLKNACSPHFAATQEQKNILIEDFKIPTTQENLIIEGAGGLLSPLGNHFTNADFILHFKLPIILVVKHYLGSINHTLTTLEYIKQKNIHLLGVVYVGNDNQSSEQFIEQQYDFAKLGRVDVVENIDLDFIKNMAQKFKDILWIG